MIKIVIQKVIIDIYKGTIKKFKPFFAGESPIEVLQESKSINLKDLNLEVNDITELSSEDEK